MRNTLILGRGRPESQDGETKAANGRAHDISETISHLYATLVKVGHPCVALMEGSRRVGSLLKFFSF